MVLVESIAVLALTLGGPLAALMLLNLRDRRQARLLRTVLDQLSSPELRGRLAVRVRCGMLSPRSLVAVSILVCSRNEIWEIMRRAQGLSREVRLEVSGPLDRCFVATFTMRVLRTEREPRPAEPALAAT